MKILLVILFFITAILLFWSGNNMLSSIKRSIAAGQKILTKKLEGVLLMIIIAFVLLFGMAGIVLVLINSKQ